MSKKVCHVTSAHSRYSTRIFMKECISLYKNGYDVTFLVNDDKEDECKDGVKIISTRFKSQNRIERFFRSNRLIMDKALEIDAEVYHLHDPDLLSVGNKLKKSGKKVIFDSHENVPDQIMDKTYIPYILRMLVRLYYIVYEKFSLRSYNAIISVTPHIVERLNRINSNTCIVTNYPIISNRDPEIVNRSTYRAVCFAGGVSPQYHHEEIIKALDTINDIRYILAGNGTKEYMMKLKGLPSWEKVEYLGVIPHTEVINIYDRSIAGLALHYSNQAKINGTLGVIKIFEYMEAGLPVICSNYRLWKEIIEGYNCGICVDPKDVEAIADAIQYLIDNPKEAEIMSQNGRKAVIEKYNWDSQEKQLLELYSRVFN